jgi:hypothetical protein
MHEATVNAPLQYKAPVIFMPRDLAFMQNHNPVYYGLKSLRCAINMERANILYANATYSFVCVAHLYNAAKQLLNVSGQGHLKGKIPLQRTDTSVRLSICANTPVQINS